MEFSRRTILLGMVLTMIVLVAGSATPAAALTKTERTELRDWRGTFIVTVTGCYTQGQQYFYEVAHSQYVRLNPGFYWGSVSWGAKGWDLSGLLYDEEFTLSTTYWVYQDENVDDKATTWLYGIVKRFGMPAGGPVDIETTVHAEPPW
ncbi:MAG: hypothetical protein ACE5H4_07425 [Candidatus Thorarchaeota archaeon]